MKTKFKPTKLPIIWVLQCIYMHACRHPECLKVVLTHVYTYFRSLHPMGSQGRPTTCIPHRSISHGGAVTFFLNSFSTSALLASLTKQAIRTRVPIFPQLNTAFKQTPHQSKHQNKQTQQCLYLRKCGMYVTCISTCTSSCSCPRTSSATPCATSCHSCSEKITFTFTFSVPVSVVWSSHVVLLLLIGQGRLHEVLQRLGVLHPLNHTHPGERATQQHTYHTLLQHAHIHV